MNPCPEFLLCILLGDLLILLSALILDNWMVLLSAKLVLSTRVGSSLTLTVSVLVNQYPQDFLYQNNDAIF